MVEFQQTIRLEIAGETGRFEVARDAAPGRQVGIDDRVPARKVEYILAVLDGRTREDGPAVAVRVSPTPGILAQGVTHF